MIAAAAAVCYHAIGYFAIYCVIFTTICFKKGGMIITTGRRILLWIAALILGMQPAGAPHGYSNNTYMENPKQSRAAKQHTALLV